MAKKELSASQEAMTNLAFGKIEKKEKKRGPAPDPTLQRKGSGNGLPQGWTRATFIIAKDTLERFNRYVWTIDEAKGKALTDVLDRFLDEYEKDHELVSEKPAKKTVYTPREE